MKRLSLLLGIVFLLSGCKKTAEHIAEDLVLKAMTDGQWHITKFINNGTTITSDFASYKFKYYSDKTVDALKNDVFEIKGNWDGNATLMTTYANFVSPAYPLDLINGTWHIDRNSWTYVEATQTVGPDTRVMRLDKL